jgi:hypothetical protein
MLSRPHEVIRNFSRHGACMILTALVHWDLFLHVADFVANLHLEM